MASEMTLEQQVLAIPAREEALSGQRYKYVRLEEVLDVIRAHLAQPAQAVDVGALRDMIEDWRTAANAHDELQYSCCGDTGRRCADELEHALAALPNANGKEGES